MFDADAAYTARGNVLDRNQIDTLGRRAVDSEVIDLAVIVAVCEPRVRMVRIATADAHFTAPLRSLPVLH